MGFDRHEERDRARQTGRRQRDSWTDIAYLIVAAIGLVLVARLWSRVIQPWAAAIVGQLTVQDILAGSALAVFVLVVVGRVWVARRRRRAARGLRVVDVPRHSGATDPMASGVKSSAQRPGQGWP